MRPDQPAPGDGVTLVPVHLDDVNALLRGDYGGRQAAPGWPHSDSAPGLGFIRSGGATFLIVDSDNRIIGECGTKTPPDVDGHVEIGYGLAPASRGKGLGSAAIRVLLDWLGQRPEVQVVEAEVHIGNTASRRLLEGLGFQDTGGPVAGYLRFQRPAR